MKNFKKKRKIEKQIEPQKRFIDKFVTNIKKRVWLMCALAHIKLSVFRNIFSRIEKIVITFSIFEKNFFKNKN